MNKYEEVKNVCNTVFGKNKHLFLFRLGHWETSKPLPRSKPLPGSLASWVQEGWSPLGPDSHPLARGSGSCPLSPTSSTTLITGPILYLTAQFGASPPAALLAVSCVLAHSPRRARSTAAPPHGVSPSPLPPFPAFLRLLDPASPAGQAPPVGLAGAEGPLEVTQHPRAQRPDPALPQACRPSPASAQGTKGTEATRG